MNYGEKLRILRAARGIKQEELSAALRLKGISVSGKTISSWERGETEPKATQALALCEILQADIYDVFAVNGINEKGLALLSDMRALVYESEKYRKKERLAVLPVYDMPASAGLGAFVDSEAHESLEVSADIAARADFGVRVSGSSMEPKYYSGDIAWVKKQSTVDIGDIGVFYLDGQCYIKKLGKGELVSINKEYPPIALGEYSELKIFGAVVV